MHERDLNNDLLLGLLKVALAAHAGLKVVLMSATIDAVRFQLYLDASINMDGIGCPVLEIPGSVFPVEIYYVEDTIIE